METKETLYSKLFEIRELTIAKGMKFPYGILELNKKTIFNMMKSVDLINIEDKIGFVIVQNEDLIDDQFRILSKGGHSYVNHLQTE